MLRNYFKLADRNTTPREPGSLAAGPVPPFRGDGQTDTARTDSCVPLPWGQLGDRAPSCCLTGGGKKLHKVVGVRISPRLGPINISNRWNKNNYIPASAFLVYFKCVTAFHFLPRLCFS